MQLGWNDENNSFHIDEHKINNTGWMMKWRWTRGVERKENPLLRECWMFLIYIFLHQQRKQGLEFALTKLREICKYLAGACNSNSHARGLHYLTFVCKTKQGKSMQWGESSLEKCFRRAQHYLSTWKEEESLCELNSLHLPPKNHTLCETWIRKGIGEKEFVATGL
jgi:hypothetical protein